MANWLCASKSFKALVECPIVASPECAMCLSSTEATLMSAAPKSPQGFVTSKHAGSIKWKSNLSGIPKQSTHLSDPLGAFADSCVIWRKDAMICCPTSHEWHHGWKLAKSQSTVRAVATLMGQMPIFLCSLLSNCACQQILEDQQVLEQ